MLASGAEIASIGVYAAAAVPCLSVSNDCYACCATPHTLTEDAIWLNLTLRAAAAAVSNCIPSATLKASPAAVGHTAWGGGPKTGQHDQHLLCDIIACMTHAVVAATTLFPQLAFSCTASAEAYDGLSMYCKGGRGGKHTWPYRRHT